MALVCVFVVIAFALGRSTGGPAAAPTQATTTQTVPATTDAKSAPSGDTALARLFQTKQSNVQVSGSGTVTRLLADDTQGGRHQRFILQLASGQTLLVAHNIDIAPRLDGLAVGDQVGFYGEYVYTDQGGTIHWTHHDPAGTHVAGWLEWRGHRFQ